MDSPPSTVAQRIAEVAIKFEAQRTGFRPSAVTVVLGHDTVVISMHGALTPAERSLARTPTGAAQLQEYHRELFASSCELMRREIQEITGVDVREAAAEVETATGTVVHVFSTGSIVQVFLLAGEVPTETWTGAARPDSDSKILPT